MLAASRKLRERYGQPIVVLNLIKTIEKRPREMILRRELASAINYINEYLEENGRVELINWDLARFAKRRNENLLASLSKVKAVD